MNHLPQRDEMERGATAILVAASTLLLIAFTAVAVDLGAGWNERRANQTASDLAAMAYAVQVTDSEQAALDAVSIASLNTDHGLTAAQWQAAWETCTDTLPTGFTPVKAPSSYSVATLQCISLNPAVNGHAEVRVTLPPQVTDTAFAGAVGMGDLTTSATAHSAMKITSGGDVLPFGLEFGVGDGQQCLSTSPGPSASFPCDGPTSGNFGSVNVPLHGNPEKYSGTTADCSPDLATLASNVAIGLDHLITAVDNAAPGAGSTPAAFDSSFDDNWALKDACSTASGSTVLTDTLPAGSFINTLNTRTGFVFNGLQKGLIGDIANIPGTYAGELPRLQRLHDSSRYVEIRERSGPTNHPWEVDNTPLWYYMRQVSDLPGTLLGATAGGVCHRGQLMSDTYDPATYFNLLAVDGSSGVYEKFADCLDNYITYMNAELAAGNDPVPLFEDDLADNPRFAWAPEFLYTPFPSGSSWMPIHDFRPVYLDNITFNCNASGGPPGSDPVTNCKGGKGQSFSPGEYPDGGTPNAAYTSSLRMDQVSTWIIPFEALPERAAATYPSGLRGPFEVQLVR